MLDLHSLARLVDSQAYGPLFVTVSGAHLYGFPSADSDIDLRGSHLVPLEKMLGLHRPPETVERKLEHAGQEVELVSHDLGKYLRLLVRNNGYVLEQIFSPLVVLGREFLDRLRPLAARCIHRDLYHHYRGFLHTQRRLLAREEPMKVKTLLYAYRVALTGLHVLRTGQVEANLLRLNEHFGVDCLEDLITQKKASERAAAWEPDRAFHERKLDDLEAELALAFEASTLRMEAPHHLLDSFLVRERLSGPRLPGEETPRTGGSEEGRSEPSA